MQESAHDGRRSTPPPDSEFIESHRSGAHREAWENRASTEVEDSGIVCSAGGRGRRRPRRTTCAPAVGWRPVTYTNEVGRQGRHVRLGRTAAMQGKLLRIVGSVPEGGRRQSPLTPAHRQRAAPTKAPSKDGGGGRYPNPTPPPQLGDESGKGRSKTLRGRVAGNRRGPRPGEAFPEAVRHADSRRRQGPLRRQGGAHAGCEAEESTPRVDRPSPLLLAPTPKPGTCRHEDDRFSPSRPLHGV